jgi:hypothetical protein
MRRVISVCIALLAMLLLCAVASAATIYGVTFANSTVTINGVGFNGTLTATLNGQKLTIVSSTPTQIVAGSSRVLDYGSYRLVVTTGKTSTFAYVTTPAPTILTGTCPYSYLVGAYTTIWLIGDHIDFENCKTEAHYPPFYGVPLESGGVLKNLRVTGQFAGTATVYVNDVPTALSCTVTTFPPDQNAVGCSDTTDRIQVNVGDFLDVGLTPSVSGMFNIQATLQYLEQ